MEQGIILEVTTDLGAGIQACATAYADRMSQAAPFAYEQKPFLANVSRLWGFGGNLFPQAAPVGLLAWSAPWPKTGPLERRSANVRALAASIAVLSLILQHLMHEAKRTGDRAPLFMPRLMLPAGDLSGASLSADFHSDAAAWISPGKMRSLEYVRTEMCDVYARLHPSLFTCPKPDEYRANVGEGDHVELGLAIGNCACMHTDSAHRGMPGYPIHVVSHNIDTAAQQLTMLAALITIAEMVEVSAGESPVV